MKRLLLLGGNSYLIPYIKAAHELGVYVITCDYLPDNIAHKYSDEYCNISIVDKEAVLKAAKELKIDGIMSPATDPGVITCAYVGEKLGLPGCPYKSVDILQHKDKFRKYLTDHGYNVPKAKGYNNYEKALYDANFFNFPVIVKPTDSAGSKGVTKVENIEELKQAINHAFEASISKNIIIEEFIAQKGSSSDTDCFSINNELVFASFNCQYFDAKAVNPYVPAAYSWPSDMPDNIQRELRSEIQRLIKELNLGTSLYNVETRQGIDGKPYIMELSPRAGGNRLSEVLKIATGQDLIMNAIKAALGMPTDHLTDPDYHGAWAEYIIHSNKAGTYQGIHLDPEFEKNHIVEKDYWLQEGDRVDTFTGANRAIGTLIMKFDSHDEAAEAVQNMERYLKIRLLEDK